jgi:hypothetical protein
MYGPVVKFYLLITFYFKNTQTTMCGMVALIKSIMMKFVSTLYTMVIPIHTFRLKNYNYYSQFEILM